MHQRFGNYLPPADSHPGMESVALNELSERMGAALQQLPAAQKQVLEMGITRAKVNQKSPEN